MSNIKNCFSLTSLQHQMIALVAEKEGWALMSISAQHDRGYRIESDEISGIFLSDDLAVRFVEHLSMNGSAVHALAFFAHCSAIGNNNFLPLADTMIEKISEIALEDGWVFGTIDGDEGEKFVISKHDEANVFGSDSDAYNFVMQKAGRQSVYHKMALAAHNGSYSTVTGFTTVNARVSLDIEYKVPNGMNADELEELLKANMINMIGNGGLTGETEATAEVYDLDVKVGL